MERIERRMVKKKEQILIMLFCIFVVSVLWFLCWKYSPFVFQENDDEYLKRLVSGSETGVPENRLLFVGVVLGTIMSSLYQINCDFPWYSLIMIGSLFISTIIFLFILLDYLTGIMEKCIGLIIYFGFFYIFLVPQIINIQFIVISSYMCGVGILLFCLGKGRKSYYILSLFTMFLALQIRKECVLMALPFVLLAWIMKYISLKKHKSIWLWAIVGMIILIAGLFLENIAYGRGEWKEFADFSVARSELYDYGMVPEFEKNRNMYQELNISQKERDIVSDYNLMFADTIDAKALTRLAELHDRKPIREVFFIVIEKNLQGNNPLTSFIWLLYFAELILIITTVKGKRDKILMIAELLSIKAGSLCLWMYLVWGGRYPDRIMVSLYFLECICVLSQFLMYKGYFSAKKIRMITVGILCLGMIVICYRKGMPYINSLKNSISVRLEYSMAFNGLMEYIEKNKANFYYIDIDVMNGGITEKVFNKDERILNQAFMGGWMVKSPWYERKFELYGLKGAEADLRKNYVYLIFKNRDSVAKKNLKTFLENKYSKVSFITEDVIKTDQEIVYEVVKANVQE